MNYFLWKTKHPEFKSLYFVCGEELALRLEVIDAVSRQFKAVRLSVDAKRFAEVEQAVLSETQQLKVITINNAQVLSPDKRDLVANWAERVAKGQLMQTVLVVHSAEINPTTSEDYYRPFVEKGRFIECKAMTGDSMVKYAVEGYNLTESAANLLVEMVSFNFIKFNNELEKLSCMGVNPIDEALIRELVVFSADDVFTTYMLNRNVKMAQLVASAVNTTTINSVLTFITKRLAFLYLVITNDAPGTNAHKLAAILSVQPWQLLEYFAYKRYWNASLILEKLKLLTQIESQFSRYESNVLVLLAKLW